MATTKWTIEPGHSEIHFKVRHLMITNVTGSFSSFEGSAETDGDGFENARIIFSADVTSLSTNNADRDGHLKSDLFFDAEKHPKLTFESTGMKKTGDDEYELTGNIAIKGTTKPITFNVEDGGKATDMRGNSRAGFSLTGKINRNDFGLTWNAAMETGGVVLSDEVKLMAEVQLVKAAE